MANAAIKFALEKLGNLITQEAALLYGVRDEVDWLQSQLRWMECFLIDAERKKKGGDERVKNWVREVRDVAYQVEDAVETFLLVIESRRQQQRNGGVIGFCKRYACLPSELKPLHNIGKEIERIRIKIRGIAESREAFGIVNLSQSSDRLPTERFQALRQLSPHLDDDTVLVGFDSNKQLVMERLLDNNMKRRCVISIVGMGGLGKTTLATMIYNSSEIKSHFHACAWISVSQDYRASDLVMRIIKTITILKKGEQERMEKMENEELKLEELKLKLYGILKGKKYLIILDDIWAAQVWEKIKSAFPNAMNGSRVLFTTRFMDVAKAAEPVVPPFELTLLNDEQSWELFIRKVFPPNQGDKPNCPEELENLGKKLVKRCGGLPLAVLVLGGLLSTKDSTHNAWWDVSRSMDWEAMRDGNECLQILALSYNDLPDHRLKSCFVYIGSFPEDSDIESSVLVKIWMAEGFIECTSKQTMEDIGMNYIDELAQRCMIQVVEKSLTDGRISIFGIHDLFRDLCISVGRESGVYKYRRFAERNTFAPRRLILGDYLYANKVPCFTTKSRAILSFDLALSKAFVRSIFHDLKLLRVIHLILPFGNSTSNRISTMEKEVPKEITSLIHLRYLMLNCERFQHLPSSMGNLCNLQTLDIRRTRIYRLPRAIWKIQTLRHVLTSSICNFSLQSSEGEHLRNLQTFVRVEAGRWIHKNLASFSNLRELSISSVSLDHGKALCDSLPQLDHLTSLSLESSESVIPFSLIETINNFEGLRALSLDGCWTGINIFPKNLSSLTLSRCHLDQDSIAAMEKITGLAFLKLDTSKIIGRKMICSAGGFPKLQHFQIEGSMTHWRIERGAMPNLNCLTIYWCTCLLSLPGGLKYLHSLKKLELFGMSQEFVKRAEVGGEDWCKISHIPSVNILYTGTTAS